MSHSNDGQRTWTDGSAVTTSIGWVATAAYLLGIVLLADLKSLRGMDLNEIGDFFAGVFSPLAFLWLILGYLLQRSELRLQRQELAVNNETQARQRDEMSRQAEVLDAQLAEARARMNGELDLCVGAIDFALHEAAGKPQTLALSLQNLGPTCHCVVFRAELLDGSKCTIQGNDRRISHLRSDDRKRIDITGDIGKGASVCLTATFIRRDGRQRIASYLVEPRKHMLIPLGVADVRREVASTDDE